MCDEFIRKRLTFRNGLELLEQARAFRVGEDFKKQLNLVIKNRHAFILTSDDLVSLPVSDLLDLIRLYRGVKTDFIIRAIHIWGRHMDEAEFQKVFRDVLYGHIKWDNLSNFAMLDLHKAGTLPMEKEHEAMLAILSRTYPIPKDESETICSLDLRISRDDHSLAYRCSLNCYCKLRDGFIIFCNFSYKAIRREAVAPHDQVTPMCTRSSPSQEPRQFRDRLRGSRNAPRHPREEKSCRDTR